jgi:chemotaxis protein CheC
MSDSLNALSPFEKDALQEIMNISFGQAAADLSDVINMHVILTVPRIDILKIGQIHPYILDEISTEDDISMIRQFFSGKFSGSSILIFPHGEGKKLLKLFDQNIDSSSSGSDIAILEKEALIEISNIIMSACISKIAGMLGDVVNYSPPRFYSQDQIDATLKEAFSGDEIFAIFFKTVFHFKEFDASGFLFLISNYNSLEWLKKAIDDYLNQYA